MKNELSVTINSNLDGAARVVKKGCSAYLKNTFLKFVSPCTIIQFKQINQPDATISPVYYLTFI
jgi:hypothetical protein